MSSWSWPDFFPRRMRNHIVFKRVNIMRFRKFLFKEGLRTNVFVSDNETLPAYQILIKI